MTGQKAQSADRKTIAISQVAVGIADSKSETGGSTMATRHESVQGYQKLKRLVWTSSEERVNCEAAPLFDSLLTHLRSPALILRVVAGKSGVTWVSEK